MIVKDIFNQLNTSVVALLFLITTTVANAQILEEITVTAQKREQSLQDVAISVTAFSGDQISSLGFTNTVDIAQQTPGMLIRQIHPYNIGINIRGVSQNDFAGHLEAPIALYLDDAYVSSMGAVHGQIFDLERIEVLRGPQGTLFGRNATGGLAHYVSRRPTESFEGYGEFTYAEYDQIKFEGAVSGPLSENLLGRLSIATNKHDGVYENRIGEDLRAAESYSARGQLVFKASEDLELHIKAAYSVDDTNGNAYVFAPSTFDASGRGVPIPAGVTGTFLGIVDLGDFVSDPITGPCPGCDPFGYIEPDNDPHTGSHDVIGLFQREIYNLQGKVTWERDGFTVTSITDYFKMHADNTEDLDASPFAAASFSGQEDREQFSQELRFSGDTDQLSWTAGFYYLDFDTLTGAFLSEDIGPLTTIFFDSSAGAIAPAFNDPSLPFLTTGPFPPGFGFDAPASHVENIDTQSWAIFGHLEYKLSDQFTLIGALRYTEDDREMSIVYDNTAFGIPIVALNPANTPGLDQSFNNVSAKAQINYTPNDDWLLYAGFTRGHKAGNFSASLFAPASVSEIPHDEEVLHSVEIGAKGTLMDGRLRLNASAFYYDYQDYQAPFFVNFSQVFSNLEAEAYGAEVELVIRPSDSLDFLFGVSLIDSKVKDVGRADGSFANSDLPNAPPVSFNGLGRYTWPAFGGNLAIQGDFNYVDDFGFGLVGNLTEKGDSYIVGNARISYTTGDEKWKLTAFVQNLGDAEYQIFAADSSFAGFSALTIANPRWFGGTVSYHWE